jgi:hypothetical protein
MHQNTPHQNHHHPTYSNSEGKGTCRTRTAVGTEAVRKRDRPGDFLGIGQMKMKITDPKSDHVN